MNSWKLSEFIFRDGTFSLRMSGDDTNSSLAIFEKNEVRIKDRGTPTMEDLLFIPVRNPNAPNTIYVLGDDSALHATERRRDENDIVHFFREMIYYGDIHSSEPLNLSSHERIEPLGGSGYRKIVRIEDRENGGFAELEFRFSPSEESSIKDALRELPSFGQKYFNPHFSRYNKVIRQVVDVSLRAGKKELPKLMKVYDAFLCNPLDPLESGEIEREIKYEGVFVGNVPADKNILQEWYKLVVARRGEEVLTGFEIKEKGLYHHNPGFWYEKNIRRLEI